ncbi:hypothetical protein FUAX_28500 [Fulvitalea axinellae]|uniref:Nuclear transport factor 2 family protein n=1 Tax=Fulvitalea axinellae TaxID=1182444 RepID=A0AAU9D386_9BACT|nr:hypothetical protein FUAX_28500 [Fulvitalea axinellae]
MSDFKKLVGEYKAMVEAGKYIEVIDRFYADDIVQRENSDAETRGKETLKNNEVGNLEQTKSVETKIITLVADTETGNVMGEMDIMIDNGDGTRTRLEEAFSQRWKNGQIVYQRYYWHSFQKIEK